jgi:hypothetical protein
MKADQQAFLDAVLGRGAAPTRLRDGRGGLDLYRNNLRALSAQALGVAFGRLRDELGDDDFASLAWTFWRHAPPVSGDLGDWGGGLADFLVERAGEASGLPDLARLDWAIHQTERSSEAPLDAASLQMLATEPPEALWLVLRPAVRLLAQRDGPVLVWRSAWRGEWRPLPVAEAAFFAAVLGGAPLATALEQAEVKGSGGEADFDFGTWLQAALQNAWLHAVRATPPNSTTT